MIIITMNYYCVAIIIVVIIISQISEVANPLLAFAIIITTTSIIIIHLPRFPGLLPLPAGRLHRHRPLRRRLHPRRYRYRLRALVRLTYSLIAIVIVIAIVAEALIWQLILLNPRGLLLHVKCLFLKKQLQFNLAIKAIVIIAASIFCFFMTVIRFCVVVVFPIRFFGRTSSRIWR